jgi:hypothetical protein
VSFVVSCAEHNWATRRLDVTLLTGFFGVLARSRIGECVDRSRRKPKS